MTHNPKQIAGDRLKQDLQIAFDEADRGEWLEWDPEKIKTVGRRLRGAVERDCR